MYYLSALNECISSNHYLPHYVHECNNHTKSELKKIKPCQENNFHILLPMWLNSIKLIKTVIKWTFSHAQSEKTPINKQSRERTHVKFLHCLNSCQLPPLWNNTCPRLKKCATFLIHVRTIKSLTKSTEEKPTIYNFQFYLSNAHVTFK